MLNKRGAKPLLFHGKTTIGGSFGTQPREPPERERRIGREMRHGGDGGSATLAQATAATQHQEREREAERKREWERRSASNTARQRRHGGRVTPATSRSARYRSRQSGRSKETKVTKVLGLETLATTEPPNTTMTAPLAVPATTRLE